MRQPSPVRAVPRQYAAPIARYGPLVNAYARRRYGISGQQLLAKLTSGESGFNMGAVSSAGARGGTQFMPATRADYIRKFGIDPWKNPDQAEHATALYLRGAKGDLQAYNPGDPGYTSYILGQQVRGLGGKRGQGLSGLVSGPLSTRFAPVSTQVTETVRRPYVASGGLPTPAYSAVNELALPKTFADIPSGGGPVPPQTITSTVKSPGRTLTIPGPGGVPKGRGGSFVLAPGANRPGVNLAPELKSFVNDVSGVYGRTLRIGTGTNHSRITVDGLVSDHWDGHAADIPVPTDSAKGNRIATSALIAAGVPAGKARQMARTGGLFTLTPSSGPFAGHRVQVIWKTNQGGNHHNHVHVGIR